MTYKLLLQRWARMMAPGLLPAILLVSAFMTMHTLPYLFTNYQTFEAGWQLQTALRLLPAQMLLHSIWGWILVFFAKWKEADG